MQKFVAEVGEGVTLVTQGDKVGVVPSRFDVRKYGTFGESILIPATALLTIRCVSSMMLIPLP